MGDIIVGIDIGTSKVCALIGLIDKNNSIETLGKGMESCTGMKKGTIVDLDIISNAVTTAVRQAENNSNLKVSSAYVNIMGSQINIQNSRVSLDISKENEISNNDIENVIDLAKNTKMTEEHDVIDVIAKDFVVDGCEEIVDPIGMTGSKLETNVDIIYGKGITVKNILKCLEKANIKVEGFVVEAHALGDLYLMPQEKEMGVVLIDVGGNMTTVSVFYNKELVFYSGISVGGEHITNDISIGLKIPQFEAERLKREFELALTSLIKNDQEILVNELTDNSKKKIKVSQVVEIIEARVHEIFSLCRNLLERSGMHKNYGGGIVLTGGGISYVDGSKELAGEVFDLPVRVASYKGLEVLKPEYAIVSGMIRHITNRSKINSTNSSENVQKLKSLEKRKSLFGRIYKLFTSCKYS